MYRSRYYHYVDSNEPTQQTQCEAGKYQNQPGRILCNAILCDENEYVKEYTDTDSGVTTKICEACPPGTYNAPGDDASGPATSCDAIDL